jgi:hypothetical protein
MNTKSILKHAASVIGVSVVLAGAAMQSVQAADNTWFLQQLQQSDGYSQNDEAAPATSPRAVVARKQASRAAADKDQTSQPDNQANPMNQAPTD